MIPTTTKNAAINAKIVLLNFFIGSLTSSNYTSKKSLRLFKFISYYITKLGYYTINIVIYSLLC